MTLAYRCVVHELLALQSITALSAHVNLALSVILSKDALHPKKLLQTIHAIHLLVGLVQFVVLEALALHANVNLDYVEILTRVVVLNVWLTRTVPRHMLVFDQNAVIRAPELVVWVLCAKLLTICRYVPVHLALKEMPSRDVILLDKHHHANHHHVGLELYALLQEIQLSVVAQ